VMLKEEKEKIQREKDQLLTEQTAIKEEMNKSLHSVADLEQEEQELVDIQVVKFTEAIQQLQVRITKLEIQEVPSTPQELHNQREEEAKKVVGRIRTLTLE
jgi:hypothetical protein